MQFRASPSSYSPPPYVFEQIEQEFGTDTIPQVFKQLESQPALLMHLWGQFHALVLQGDLPRMLKEMVGLVVSANGRCNQICTVLSHSLSEQQADQQTLAAIVKGDFEAAAVSHATLAVLQFTAVAIRQYKTCDTRDASQWQHLQDQTRQALNDTGLEEGEQVELVATIALFEQLCFVTNLLQLDPT